MFVRSPNQGFQQLAAIEALDVLPAFWFVPSEMGDALVPGGAGGFEAVDHE